MFTEIVENCINKTIECHVTCLETFDDEMDCIGSNSMFCKILMDTARMTLYANESLLLDSVYNKDICELCAQICLDCSEKCEEFGYKECARKCNECAGTCETVAHG